MEETQRKKNLKYMSFWCQRLHPVGQCLYGHCRARDYCCSFRIRCVSATGDSAWNFLFSSCSKHCGQWNISSIN